MLRNPKREEIDEESGDESPLIVPPGKRSSVDSKKKNSATSSCSPLSLIVMLAFVVGIGVGTFQRDTRSDISFVLLLFICVTRAQERLLASVLLTSY